VCEVTGAGICNWSAELVSHALMTWSIYVITNTQDAAARKHPCSGILSTNIC
jgi:hypothetical protein